MDYKDAISKCKNKRYWARRQNQRTNRLVAPWAPAAVVGQVEVQAIENEAEKYIEFGAR